jgi:thiol-disulfide isomerase/thioredoxin
LAVFAVISAAGFMASAAAAAAAATASANARGAAAAPAASTGRVAATATAPATATATPAATAPATAPVAVPAAKALALRIGDQAPRYELNTWLKGPPVPRLERGHIYVLEFWATRCAPCIEALPHLKELADTYAGKVTFIAIGEPYDWETVDSVQKFVRKKDKLMTYPVALDALKGKGEKMYDRWGPPAGFAGLPVTFIVDGAGKVAWTGLPTSVDEPLKQIVAGKYDMAAARKQQQADHDAVFSENEQRERFRTLLQQKDYAAVIKRADDLVARHPEQEGLVFAFKLAALSETNLDSAVTYAETLPEDMQGTAAEILSEKPNLSKPVYQFIAQQLEKEVARDPNAHVVTWQNLAKVQHELGNLDRAIQAQKTALAKSDAMGYGEISKDLRTTLDAYQAEKSRKR